MAEQSLKRGFGLYVHWPFCTAKCPYCDFNSHVRTQVDQSRWATAFERDIAFNRERVGPGTLTSVFFGGGTPSLMEPFVVERVLTAARSAWSFANDIEITLEANPTSVEAARFTELASAGVNRVSVGVQALNDTDLRALGRTHTVDEALKALSVAKEAFPRVSFDLMYGRQDQSVDAWKAELSDALSLNTDHVSLYQLTIEPETPFGARAAKGKLRGLPDEDVSFDLWTVTQDLCQTAGLLPYETSNFARPGQESRHNLTYWLSGDWVGVGPGAHGRSFVQGRRLATETELRPEAWLDRVEQAGNGEAKATVLTTDEIREERLLMGLRLTAGIDLDEDHMIQIVEAAKQSGVDHFLQINGTQLAVTEEGRPLLNAILAQIA